MKKLRLCLAPRCKTKVKRPRILCDEDWALLPQEIKERLGNAYREGQDTKGLTPSGRFLEAKSDAYRALLRMKTKRAKMDVD